MSGPTPGSDPSRPTGARAEYLIALFVAISWAAVVFAVFGGIAILLDREVIPAGISPYYGLLALLAASVVVWLAVARSAPARSPWLGALVAGAGVYLLMVLSGGIAGFGLLVSQATSPFVIAAALLAVVTVVVSWASVRAWRAR